MAHRQDCGCTGQHLGMNVCITGQKLAHFELVFYLKKKKCFLFLHDVKIAWFHDQVFLVLVLFNSALFVKFNLIPLIFIWEFYIDVFACPIL